MNDEILAKKIAEAVSSAGGRAFFVGGYVRDMLMGIDCKDIDIEVYGIEPARLRELLTDFGEVYDKGAAFGVLGLRHSDLDIAMPRKESLRGTKHTDFDVSVDPFLTYEEASMRRDFTINAMMLDPLTGEIVDCWNGKADLEKKIIRHVSDETFGDDALRVFRAAQFAARMNAEIVPETMDICRRMNVTELSKERIYEELTKALLKAETPSIFFRALRAMGHLTEFFTEIDALIDVPQNPKYHPEGDVFEHTMLTLDAAAHLRHMAKEPLNFMLAALMHDLGKANATEISPEGKITSYMHPDTGVPLAETQLKRLTNNTRTIAYVKNMVWLHMRPNMLASADSKKKKSREMYDMSLCPEDLILISRSDATGKTDAPYNMKNWTYLTERLKDYYTCIARPMVTGADLTAAGVKPGKHMGKMIARARSLHFSGVEKHRALTQVIKEYKKEVSNAQ
ncbi:MAG: HD domain-containing protein [Clostridia bacterium]|nr:HD domain-containing protein [Clostridia bacterium]